MGSLNIKYEDSEILLAVKPAGIASQSRRIGEADMVSMARNWRAGNGEPDYIALIHRLDQPVGGLLLFAKTKKAAAGLSAQLQAGKIEKYYQALLYGRIEEEGELTDYLIRDGRSNLSRAAEKGEPGAKEARLKFRRLKVFSVEADGLFRPVSLVEIKLETGRHHQIRVQMAHHGFPLLGDKKYTLAYAGESAQKEGTPDADKKNYLDITYPKAWGRDRCFPALFAWKLRFRHPKTGKWMEFTEEPEFGIQTPGV